MRSLESPPDHPDSAPEKVSFNAEGGISQNDTGVKDFYQDRFVNENTLDHEEAIERSRSLQEMWTHPSPQQLETLFDDIDLKNLPENEYAVIGNLFDPNKEQSTPVEVVVKSAVEAARQEDPEGLKTLGALRQVADRVMEKFAPQGGEGEWKTLSAADKTNVRYAEMMSLAAQAGLVEVAIERNSPALDEQKPLIVGLRDRILRFQGNIDIPPTFKNEYLQKTVDLVNSRFPDSGKKEQPPTPPEKTPEPKPPHTVKWNVSVERQTQANQEEVRDRRASLDRVLTEPGYIEAIGSIVQQNLVHKLSAPDAKASLLNNKERLAQENLRQSLEMLNRMRQEDKSPFELLREAKSPAEFQAMKLIGAALIDRYFEEKGQKKWAELKPAEKYHVRLGEMLILEAERRKVKTALKTNVNPTDHDKKRLQAFEKVVDGYLKSDDIPEAFKNNLRKTTIELSNRYPEFITPLAEELPKPNKTKTEQWKPLPLFPDKEDYSWVSRLIEEETKKREAAKTEKRPPMAIKLNAEEVSRHLNGLTDAERKTYYDARFAHRAAVREYVSKKDLERGTEDAVALLRTGKATDWYKERLTEAVNKQRSESVLGKDGVYGKKFIDSLPQQLTYGKQSRWGQFWTRTKVFGFWGTIRPQWLGGTSKERLQGVRHEIADNLRQTAIQETDDYYTQRTMDNSDRVVFARIADAMDTVNLRELRSTEKR